MKKMLKNLINWLLQKRGHQLVPIRSPLQEQWARETILEEARTKRFFMDTRWLRNLGINTILDIGANRGQSAKIFREMYSRAQIYSFEPIGECFQDLVRLFADDPRFRAFNYALGSESAVAEFHRNEYSESSSLLSMADLHSASFPQTAQTAVQKIELRRLDDIVSELDLRSPILVKIDVQGYESEVISGGLSSLSKADVLIVEMSLKTLYQNQVLFDGIYRRLTELGFVYSGNLEQLHSPVDGAILQVDGIFVKPKAAD